MTRPRFRILVVTLLAAALPWAVGLQDAEAASATVSPTIGAFPICSNCVQNASDLSRYQYVTLNAWQHDVAARLKAANPQLRVLVYKDMSSTRSYACRNGADDALLPAGVGYCWAEQTHPDWFTTDQAGSRIEWDGFPGHWQMDVNNQAYQDRWYENVLSELRTNGWDGVTIDNANVDPSGYFGDRTAREFPSQPAFAAASRSFLASVGPRLKAQGFLVLPNIQANPVLASGDVWRDWIQFTSGGVREYWMKWSHGPGGHFGGTGWTELLEIFETVQSAGKIFLTSTTGPRDDVRTMRWARASFLIGWDGGEGALAFETGSSSDPWSPEWTIDIGRPVGSRVKEGSVWSRSYTAGTALANTSTSATQTVRLSRPHFMPDGTPTTSVTLGPLTGLVLRADQALADSAGATQAPAGPAATPKPKAPAPRPKARRRTNPLRGAVGRLHRVELVRRKAPSRLRWRMRFTLLAAPRR